MSTPVPPPPATESTYPVAASATVSAVAPSAIPVVSPAVHTPPKVPAAEPPCRAESTEITSGSIDSGSDCMPA